MNALPHALNQTSIDARDGNVARNDHPLYVAALKPLLDRGRRDIRARKGNNQTICERLPLDDTALLKHVAGSQQYGAYFLSPGETTTRKAALDFDSHNGESTWEEMRTCALKVITAAKAYGLMPNSFRSRGGRGVNVLYLWNDPQDAYTVRKVFGEILGSVGLADGARGGIAAGVVEVFPKQDVGSDVGHMLYLPLAGKSVPLDEEMQPLERSALLDIDWSISDSMPTRERPVSVERSTTPVPVELEEISKLIDQIPNAGEHELPYEKGPEGRDYLSMIIAIHRATDGSDDGLTLAHALAAKSSKYDAKDVDHRYRSVTAREGGITVETLRSAARHFSADCTEQFGVVKDPVDSQGQPLREPTIRERIEQCGNAAAILDLLRGVDREMIDEKDLGVLKDQSKKTLNTFSVDMTIREIDAEIGRNRRLTPAQKRAIRAAESDAPDPQSEHLARRREQQRKNVELQAGGAVEFAQVMTVEQMEQQLVYVKEGQVVASLVNPRMALLNAEFSRAYKASVHFVHSKSGAQKKVKNTETWFESEERITVETRTFRAGGNPITTDPDGKSAINSWRSTKRPESTASAQPFIEQVRFLFKQDTEKFLDWLAHIEQKPGELPHYGFLHISKMHGTGRNWLASVLARVWRGYVAPNVDLAGLLNSAFNGELSGRILAQVDEIREGGTDTFRHAQLLKSIVNPEFRLINPKFGRQYKEFNSCRWLAFSQHDNALPLEDNDRRWWVVKCTEQPRPPEVYTALYKLIDNEQFINAVANMLASRDIRTFNAGERPPLSEAKRAAIQASKSSFGRLADELVRYWPSDLIINPDVANTMLEGVAGSIGRGPTLPMRRSLEDAGCQHGHGGKPVKVGGKIEKFWILRNVDRWSVAAPHEITRELGNVSSEFGYCAYDVLLDAMADAELGDLI